MIINELDSTFIETARGEPEETWRRAVEVLLMRVWSDAKPNWWHPFSVGPTVTWRGRRFRSFRCDAGSVSAHLVAWGKRMPLPRAVILVGRDEDGRRVGRAYCGGLASEFDADEVFAE